MRAFIAIEIAAAVREAMVRAQATLRATGADLKYVGADQMHLTLAFLGDVDEGILPGIKEAMDAAGRGTPAFSLAVAGCGQFGPARSPRVIWVGLEAEGTPLLRLQAELARGMVAAGVALDEKPFHPHLTLARVRSPRRVPELLSACERVAVRSLGVSPVEHLVLMRSELRPSGPCYTALHMSALSV